jgi:HAD superfamily hydrolase (TIGR01509 family)
MRLMPISENPLTAILFDWDGTLADSAPRGYSAFQKMFRELELKFDDDIYERIYSPNWHLMYEAVGLPRVDWQKADDLWIQHYGREPLCLVEGAYQTIQELGRKGYALGVVTSGSAGRIRREIGELFSPSVFQVVICNEDTVHKKPHPEGLEKAMTAIHRPPEACAYVGDSPEDITMSKQAGLFSIGVRSEYPCGNRLVEAGPDMYLDSIVQLLEFL